MAEEKERRPVGTRCWFECTFGRLLQGVPESFVQKFKAQKSWVKLDEVISQAKNHLTQFHLILLLYKTCSDTL